MRRWRTDYDSDRPPPGLCDGWDLLVHNVRARDKERRMEPNDTTDLTTEAAVATAALLSDKPVPHVTEHIEQFFTFEHLPEHLQEVSRPFAELAHAIVNNLPRNPERTVALRKLLEGKDAAVRAVLAK